jgi:HK97 family phage prohead protease
MEQKTIPLDLKDFDKPSRTAIIAHAVYDNIDRTKEISRKGMFTKSWADTGTKIKFYKNHDQTSGPGKVIGTSEDNEKAYTHVSLGTHTEGQDTLLMMDEGIITDASFGYKTIKSNPLTIKGQKVVELKEVWHGETSVLTKMPANALAGVVSVCKMFEVKSFSDIEKSWIKSYIAEGHQAILDAMNVAGTLSPQHDLYSRIQDVITNRSNEMANMKSSLRYDTLYDGKSFFEALELKEYITNLKKFVKDTTASDDCILAVTEELKAAETIYTQYVDTVGTLLATEPSSSDLGDEVAMAILFLKNKF